MNASSTAKTEFQPVKTGTLLLVPVKFGTIIGLYVWVAKAPFGFLHPDANNWLFFWRLLPFWQLPTLIAISIVGVAALELFFVWLRRRKDGAIASETTGSLRRAFSPVYFLLVSPMQLIPGAIGLLPVLPLITKLILPVGVFSSVLFLFVIETNLFPATVFRKLDGVISSHKWRWSVGLFLASLLTYGVFMKRFDTAFGYTGGDEAHYLVQAQSLAEDFDRDLVNQLPDYAHTPTYYLTKHLSAKSPPGKAYSYHSIGLPLLLAPGWAVEKMKGAMRVMIAISSVFAVTLFWIALKLRPRSEFALSCWAIFCFTTPIIFYACRAYPELPSGLTILFVVWKMRRAASLTRWGWLAVGALVGFLPWLHIPRLMVPTVLLSAWGIVWLFLRGKKKHLTFFVLPLILSASLLVILNQHWYGYDWNSPPGAAGFEKFDPQSWTGGYYHQPKELFSCLPGLIGIIMDRYKGILVCSPVYFIPLVCLLLGVFSRKLKFWRELWLWVFVAVYIPALSRKGWYGGACFPSRFLISVLPLLVFPLAAVFSKRGDRLPRAFFAVLAAFSGWITLRMLLHPDHFYRGAENARWSSPAGQLIALFYPYAGTFHPVYRIEDPFGITLFVLWAAATIVMLQWSKRKEIPWHKSFNLTIAAVLVLPLFTTAIRRLTNHHPYQFSFSEAIEHYSTLIGINQRSSARLRVAKWGKIAPESLAKQLILELPAADQKTQTGEIQIDELANERFLTYDPAKHKPGYLCWTNPLKIFPGHYVARFWLSADGSEAGGSIALDIRDTGTGRIIAARRLAPSDVSGGAKFTAATLPFCLSRYGKLSLRVRVGAAGPLRLLKFSIEPLCLGEILSAVERSGAL